MLNFFRKYQKIFFLFTTVIIVVSFLFFGTYQAIAPSFHSRGEEKVSYENQMAHFSAQSNGASPPLFFCQFSQRWGDF